MLGLKPLLALGVFSSVEHSENQSKADSTKDKTEQQRKPERGGARIRMCHPDGLRNREQSPEREGQGEDTQHPLAKFGGGVHRDHCPRERGCE